jgi:ribonuclease HII
MILIGIDEVGRGCVAGPVVAASVVIDTANFSIKVTDSKLLSQKQREYFDSEIKSHCLDFSISIIEPEVIDKINIHYASLLAMKRSYEGLKIKSKNVKCDGKFIPEIENISCHIKGDLFFKEISAASILAKVYRDHLMQSIAQNYPQYFFEKHKGYLTKIHKDAIDKYGATPIHRKSFKPFR